MSCRNQTQVYIIKVFNLQEMHLLKMKSSAIITLNEIKPDIASETACFIDKNVAILLWTTE
jgi:hypothetical protein